MDGCGYQRRILCILGKELNKPFEHILEFVLAFHKDLLHLGYLSVLGFHHGIYVESVSLIGRNTSGGSMRLDDIAHLLKVRHLIPDGCRTKVKIGVL